MKDFLILTTIAILSLSRADACSFNGPSNFSFGASLVEESGAFIDPETNKILKPSFLLTGCSSTKRKFLQFSLGVIEDYIDNGSNITAINEDFEPASCKILNSPLEQGPSREEVSKRFKGKRLYLNSCFDFYVTSSNGSKVTMPEQKYCKFEKVKENKFLLKGNLCYFDITKSSSFLFSVKAKEKCFKKKFFKENKIDLQDILSHVGFNVANTADGTGLQMVTVGAATIRMSIDPLKEQMPVSDNFGRQAPLFPAVWSIPDVHFGKIKVTKSGKFKEISADFLASNTCKEKCVDGLCSSPCHYSSPVAAEIELYEIPSLLIEEEDEDDDFFDDFGPFKSLKAVKKPELIETWYNGGVAAPNWQGLIPGRRISIKKEFLETGKRYRMRATFRGPKLDYLFLMKKYRSLLPPMPDFTSLADGIPMGISGSGISLDDIAGTMNGVGTDGVQRALKKLHSLFSYSSWPIYVDYVCNSQLQNCKKPEKKNNLVLEIDFDLVEDPFSRTGSDRISRIQVKRKSNVLESYKKDREEQPTIFCDVE